MQRQYHSSLIKPSVRGLVRSMATQLRERSSKKPNNGEFSHCNESCSNKRFVCTNCTDNHENDRRLNGLTNHTPKKKEILRWDMFSEDEKNIYIAHKVACQKGENSYADPVTGYMVFTEEFLAKRGTCCGNGCRHCPYGQENVPQYRRKKTFNSAFYV